MNTINSAIGVLTRRTPTAWRPRQGHRLGCTSRDSLPPAASSNQATLGIVGEAGPEAVIPLNRARGMIGGTTEVHVHVSGSVFATKEQMAREVVAALQNAKNRGPAQSGGMMGRPSTFVVEIAFSGGWSDVTAYHDYNEPTTIKRGRNSVLDTAQPGTLSLTLFNNDGRFSRPRDPRTGRTFALT